ncbi:hypothetical protein MOQ_007198 [Trypanosoma cruzi marinkellei]|uniref:Uncharacterized protein n=1 Tax=Trypanosoma cruzi marinkellei TaxID=85056 RepID=K2MTN4_TRYCR|nr:hypothetical protein MOQ_007198 [Trypanosoma cruzi marinkellei]
MAPDPFVDLVDTVEKYATRGSYERGCRIDTREESTPSNKLVGYPFANAEGVGVHFSYKKGDITLSTDVSSNPKATWRDVLPTVSWTRSLWGQQHDFLLRLAMTPLFAYSFSHPQFTCSSEVKFMDGFRSKFTTSTQISTRNQLGASVEYDPSRSGLIDYTVAFLRVGCSAVQGGDFIVKYNATHGLGVHTRIPVKPFMSAVALVERGRVIIGTEARSPCGAQMMMNVDLVNSRAMLAFVRNISAIWKLTFNYSAPLPGSCSASGRFGLVFTSQDAPWNRMGENGACQLDSFNGRGMGGCCCKEKKGIMKSIKKTK